MTVLLKVISYNHLFASCCGIIANIVLMFLINTVNKSNMKQISHTLLQNSILDLFLALTVLIDEPQIAIYNDVYYAVNGSLLHRLGFTYASIVNSLFASAVVLSVLAMPVPFYIRYTVLCRNTSVNFKKLILIYIIIFLYSMGLFCLTLWWYPPLQETFEKHRAALQTEFWLDEYKSSGPFFVAFSLKERKILVLFAIILFANVISYSFVTYFAIVIAKNIKQNKFKLSPRTLALNKQLQKTLIVQTIGPFLTGNLPISIIMGIIFLNIDSPSTTLCAASILSWVAVINPLAAIFIIKPYRQKIAQLLKIQSSQVSSIYASSKENNNREAPLATVSHLTKNDNN